MIHAACAAPAAPGPECRPPPGLRQSARASSRIARRWCAKADSTHAAGHQPQVLPDHSPPPCSLPPLQPPTVIFHLSARFKADTHPKKLNLGVGAYRTEELKPYVFSAVRKAEAAVVAAGFDKEYLPITGLPAFTVRAAADLGGSRSAGALDPR